MRIAIMPLFALLALLGAGYAPATGAEDLCWSRDASGKCLDDVLPATGQYTAADTHTDETPVGIDRKRQPHGVVRLRESTFIDAHDICRFVDNGTTRGPGLFIGLNSRAEWSRFALEGKNPAGSTVIRCCRPVTVEVCGTARAIPYSKQGDQVSVAGGHDRVVTYTCAAGTSGAAPTFDTSWLMTEQGACEAPDDGICPDGKRWYNHKNSPTGQTGCFGPGDWGQTAGGESSGGGRGDPASNDGPGGSDGRNDGGGTRGGGGW